MPYSTIKSAKDADFPISAGGIILTLVQVNKLAEIYDTLKAGGKVENPMAVAWVTWKKVYEKKDGKWQKRVETHAEDGLGIGGTDICVCSECGYETKHERGIACNTIECPDCGAKLAGKDMPQTGKGGSQNMKNDNFKEQSKLGEYSVTENDNGSLTIHDVPIFATIEKDKKAYDEDWLAAAVSNFEAQKAESGYKPAIIIGHNTDNGEEKESVGLLDAVVKKGKKVFADLTNISKEIFEKIKNGSFPYRSVETWYAQKRITALALLGGSTPAHKFHPIHVFSEAPEGELEWVNFADSPSEISEEGQKPDLSETLKNRMKREKKENELRDAKWVAQEMMQNVFNSKEISIAGKKAYIVTILNELAEVLKANSFQDTSQQQQEEKKMENEKTRTELFSEEQKIALNAIVAEQVREATATMTEEKQAFEEKITGLEAEVTTQKESAITARNALAERTSADTKAKITRFVEGLRTDGMNAGLLDEGALSAFMMSLAVDEKAEKFTEKGSEVTKLDHFQAVMTKVAELATKGTLIVPLGDVATGKDQEQVTDKAGKVSAKEVGIFSEESIRIDEQIRELAEKRKINLDEDVNGTRYAQLFLEVRGE